MQKRTKQLAIGTVFAAVGGYLAGVLTAPKSGKQTRKQIKDKAIKARSDAEKQLKSLHSDLDKAITQAKNSGDKLKSKAGVEFKQALAKATAAKNKARQILSSIHEGEGDDQDLQEAIKEVNGAVTHLKKFVTKKANNVKAAAK